MISRNPTSKVAAIGAALALTIAACGSDSDDAVDEVGDTVAEATDEVEEAADEAVEEGEDAMEEGEEVAEDAMEEGEEAADDAMAEEDDAMAEEEDGAMEDEDGDAMEDEDGGEEAAGPGNIVEVADEAGNFTTLLGAADAAGIVSVLESPGTYTIFAPTDEAFAALPEGLVDTLLAPENQATLTAILTYHGLTTEVPSSDIAEGPVATIQGDEIEISVTEDGTVMVNDATVTAVDIEASNGVIHVIDSVLVPPSVDLDSLLGGGAGGDSGDDGGDEEED